MSWWNPFKKEAPTGTASPEAVRGGGLPSAEALPKDLKELENDPKTKGLMAAFYRKWKDPSFLKQLKVLAAHMQKDGVDVKDMKAVQAWLEKNKAAIDNGAFKEPPPGPGGKVETYIKTGPEIGRNDPCSCGSGKKYKKCCANK